MGCTEVLDRGSDEKFFLFHFVNLRVPKVLNYSFVHIKLSSECNEGKSDKDKAY